MRKPFSVIVLICALLGLSACASRTKTADYALSSEYVSLDMGSTYKLSIEYDTLRSYDFDIEWVSDDPEIAEVVDGTLYGIDAGVTSVWAELTVHTEEGDTSRRLRCTVTVKDNRVEPQSIYFDSPSLTVLQYTQAVLQLRAEPEGADLSGLVWSSSDESVVSVSEDGRITAVGLGSASVSVSLGADGPEAFVEVTVERNPDTSIVQSIVLDRASVSLYEGRTTRITAAVLPESYDGEVIFSTSDSSVAVVTSDGVIRAVGEGTATVSATAGGVTEYCSVEVLALRQDFVAAERVKLDRDSVKVLPGSEFTLSATVYPFNSTQPGSWSSSDPAVVTVDSAGNAAVVGAAGSSAVITYRISASVYAQCAVTVASEQQTAQSVALSQTELILQSGSSFTLSASASPATATDTFVWESSAPDIVSVAGGRLTALRPGEAEITVRSAENSSVSAVCAVTVASEVRRVTFELNGGQALVKGKFYKPVFSEPLPEQAQYRVTVSNRRMLESTRSLYDGTDKISFYAIDSGVVTVAVEVISQDESVMYIVEPLSVRIQ